MDIYVLFDLYSVLYCFSCFGRSVEMIYDVCMLSPVMGGPRYGLIVLIWRDL